MATLREVAEIAKVNISTVSRFLSGELRVKPDTERRIRGAMALTDYHPNIIARSLRQGRTNTLAAIVPDIYQPGISGIVEGIDRRISETGYTLVLLMTGNDAQREQAALNTVLEMMIDGAIVVGRAFGATRSVEFPDDERNPGLNAIKRADVPVIFVSRNASRSSYSEVCPDQKDGAYQLTRHLLDRGRRSIGVILGRRGHPIDALKLAGYRRALREAGVVFREDLVAEAFFMHKSVPSAVDRLLLNGVDAILCSTDMMAVAALRHVHEAGLTVPGDVAVAGYGGTYWADSVTPKLTTVDVRLENLGKEAAEALLSTIANNVEAPTLRVLPVQLRIGEST